MRGSNQTHSIEADQSSWMNEVAIAHWAAWYCINIRDEDEIRELITTQFACWKYLKERKTTIPVSGRMKQRAAEFNKFLDEAKEKASKEQINAYLFPKKSCRR